MRGSMAEVAGPDGVRSWARCGILAVSVAVALPVWLGAAAGRPGETDPPSPRGGVDHPRTPDRSVTGAERADHGLDAIRGRWLGELHRLGDDPEGATRAIAAIQQETFRHHSLRGLDKLHRYQVTMATTLAARDRACFRPILWAHYRTAEHHRGPGELALRGPALAVAADIATAMARSRRSDDDGRFAIDVMLCAGHTLLDDGARGHAQRLFERVVRLDPSCAPALLGAAAVDERYGRSAEVVGRLRSAVDDGVGDDEVRLRLAVNLSRSGQGEAAAAVLETLAAGAETPWVRVVASQELARHWVAVGMLDRAEVVLRRAIDAIPGVSGLRVQLAWVLDRAGRPAAAAREVESIDPALTSQTEAAAARWRYAQWPAFDRPAVEARLEREAAAAAPVLAEVLRRMDAGEAS